MDGEIAHWTGRFCDQVIAFNNTIHKPFIQDTPNPTLQKTPTQTQQNMSATLCQKTPTINFEHAESLLKTNDILKGGLITLKSRLDASEKKYTSLSLEYTRFKIQSTPQDPSKILNFYSSPPNIPETIFEEDHSLSKDYNLELKDELDRLKDELFEKQNEFKNLRNEFETVNNDKTF